MAIIIGVICGFACALCQSAGYLLSRMYVIKRVNGNMQLMVTAHVWLTVISLPMIWILWPENMPEIGEYVWPMLGDVGGYMMGQAGLFFVLSKTDASRIAPLLGLKILVIALAMVLFLGGSLTQWQWAAVGISVAAAFLLNKAGGGLPKVVLVGVGVTVIGYTISDINIEAFIEAIKVIGPIRAAVLSMSLTFIACGVVGVALLPWYGTKKKEDWLAALPYALSWLASMTFFYIAIALIDVVFTIIIQSSRGIISVVMGVMVASYLGMEHLETKHERGVVVRRAFAAVMMAVAISVYACSKVK